MSTSKIRCKKRITLESTGDLTWDLPSNSRKLTNICVLFREKIPLESTSVLRWDLFNINIP